MTHETDYRVHLTLKSRNEKTGPIPVSTTSATTCASACPFASGNGCYADGGPLAIHWRKVTTGLAGKPWAEFVEQITALPVGQIWRHNQAGDLPGDRVTIDQAALSLDHSELDFQWVACDDSRGDAVWADVLESADDV